MADSLNMTPTLDMPGWLLLGFGLALMALIVLRSIGQGAVIMATGMVEARRASAARQREENATAEAEAQRAAMEPLALNADGTVEEPIIGVVETH
jgi:hypothetical protein